jgi:cellulose synthase/poly-beta-1,6-N-acetylglucosamine synthase-like glycosyltransferase
MSLFTYAYLGVLALLALYGFHRAQLVFLYLRHRRGAAGSVPGATELPVVTVQLPLYNERYVAARLIEAVGALDWPSDRLEIQVLDDSTDDTSDICARGVAALRARGLDAHHLRRDHRAGFKAGALAYGLERARGELLLVFDADFVPGPDLLRRAVGHFADGKVAMVQLRWEHLNRETSALTATQALLLDGHFVVEHGARHRARRFFNFSGTAGIWRKAAIVDAGSWQHDTLTEDMDLSYRAQLRGWRFVFDAGTAVPAELPVEMNAFKSQQFRWAKGQMQVARKLLPAVLRAPLPVSVKLEAFFHLTNNVAYALLLAVCLLAVPNLAMAHTHRLAELIVDAPIFFGATLAIAGFYVLSQRELGPSRGWRALARLPWLMALCAGLCVSQARAVVEALLGRDSEFVRTPKRGVRGRGDGSAPIQRGYRGVRTMTSVAELALSAYMGLAIVLAVQSGHWLTVPFLALFAGGFAYVGALSLLPAR